MGDGLQGPGQGRRPFRDAAEPHDRALGLADAGFAFDPLAVFEFGPEAHIGIGGGHHLALHRQHPAAGRDRRFQAAGDRRKGREEQVAEAVALQAAAGLEAVLEQAGEQRFFGGEGRQAVADVAGGLHPQLAPQHPTAAAVIGHRDDGREVAAVALQAREQGGQAGAATDGDDVGAAVELALGQQGIHQHRVLFGRQGLLDRLEAAALAQPDQAAAHHQHHRSGNAPRHHRGDVLQQPVDRFQAPVDRLEIEPHGAPQQGQKQAQARGHHPALHHQPGLQPAHRPLGAAHQIPLAQVAPADPAGPVAAPPGRPTGGGQAHQDG